MYGTRNDQQAACDVDVVREAGPSQKARETLSFLGELEALTGELRLQLYGPYPATKSETANQVGNSLQQANKPPHEPCLEEVLQMICQRSAMAVGELKTILKRL